MPDLTIEAARALLESHVPIHEDWDQHSEVVALVAAHVSDALEHTCTPVDKQFVVTSALLHDIGRSKTHHPTLHGIAGYSILAEHGYPAHALVCLTHVLKGRSLHEADEERIFPHGLLSPDLSSLVTPLNLENRIIAVADAMVLDTEIVDIQTRYRRSRLRYHKASFVVENERLSQELKASIELMLHRSIYDVLPRTLLPPPAGSS